MSIQQTIDKKTPEKAPGKYNYADLIAKVDESSAFVDMRDSENPNHIITDFVLSSPEKKLYNATLIEEKGNRVISFFAPTTLATRIENIEKAMATLKLQSQNVVLFVKYAGKKKSNKGREMHQYFVQILEPESLIEVVKEQSEQNKAEFEANAGKPTSIEDIKKQILTMVKPEQLKELIAKEIADLNGLIDEDSAILLIAKRLGL